MCRLQAILNPWYRCCQYFYGTSDSSTGLFQSDRPGGESLYGTMSIMVPGAVSSSRPHDWIAPDA